MISARDMRAMRRALEVLRGVDSIPAELRALFAPREATVRLAAEMAVMGGRAFMPADPPHAWIDLWGEGLITGWLRGGAEMRVAPKLIEAFETQRNGGTRR